MGIHSVKKTILSICIVLVSLGLVSSLGLHTVQIDHVHPGQHETSHDSFTISEYVHGNEKNLFLMIVLAFLGAGAYVLLRSEALLTRAWIRTFFRAETDNFRRHDYLQQLFGSGLLNSKVH